jgi:hypothetical protein
MDNTRITKSIAWKISWNKTCGKTMAEMERHHHEGCLVAAGYEDGGGWQRTGTLGGEILKGLLQAVVPMMMMMMMMMMEEEEI